MKKRGPLIAGIVRYRGKGQAGRKPLDWQHGGGLGTDE